MNNTIRAMALLAGAALLLSVGACSKKADLSSLDAIQTDDITEGAATAPITLVIYGSPLCKHCVDFFEQGYPALQEQYIETGKVRLIYRLFPTYTLNTAANIDEQAQKLLYSHAETLTYATHALVRCVGKDKSMVALRDVMHEYKRAPESPEDERQIFFDIANKRGLSEEQALSCMDNEKDMVAWSDNVEIYRKYFKLKKSTHLPAVFVNGKLVEPDGGAYNGGYNFSKIIAEADVGR